MITLNGNAINLDVNKPAVLTLKLERNEEIKHVNVGSNCLITPEVPVTYYADDKTNFLGIYTLACLKCPARIDTNLCESYYLPSCLRV